MSRVERSEATRALLVETARGLFAQRGYAAVGTEEIVRAAGLTRGALYHHFADKRDLFRAVVEDVEQRLAADIARTAGAVDPADALLVGARAFLDACREQPVRRIGLIDAPAVLGWEEFRAIDERYGLGLVQATLQAAMDAGAIARQPVRPLAHVLLGAITEAGMMVAQSGDPAATRDEVAAVLQRLIEGLRG